MAPPLNLAAAKKRRPIDPGFQAHMPLAQDRGFLARLPARPNIDPGFNAGAPRVVPPRNTPSLAAAAAGAIPHGTFKPSTVPMPGPASDGAHPRLPGKKTSPGAGQVAPGQVPRVAQQLTMEQQAAQTVQQLLQPLIDQINQSATTRSTQGTAAIQGYADALAKELGAVDYGAPYAGAKQEQAAVDSSLAQAASGQGLTDAASLSSRLGVINDPTVGAAADAVAATGAANGTTLLAQGSSALGQLISNEASAKSYGLKQPGLAKLGALQDISKLQGSISADQFDALSKLAAQSPQLALSYLGQLRSQQNSDRTFKASSKKEAYQEWLGMQKLGQTSANQSFNEWYKQQQLGQGQQRIDIAGANLTLAQQKRADALEQKVKTGGYTPKQLQGLAAQAQKTAAAAWNGAPKPGAGKQKTWHGHPVAQVKLTADGTVDPANGVATWVYKDGKGNLVALAATDIPDITTATPATHQTYQEAIRDMLAAKIPLSIAQRALNAYWTKPGQQAPWEKPGQGRPKLSYQQRNPGKAGAAQGAAYAGRQLSHDELASLWIQAGGDPSAANTAAAVALAESGGKTDALNNTPSTGDYSVSPWQINYYQGLRAARTRRFGTPEQLLADPLRAAKAAVAISKNGRDFSPWTTYTSGKYRSHLA